MSKQISMKEAAAMVKSGMTVMMGGFLTVGGPNKFVDALLETDVKDLTLICNDSAYPDRGLGKLIVAKRVKKIIVSYIGANPATTELMNSGEMEVEFAPQGTLAERIRAAGAGLGGVLTPTGLGTVIAEGKEVLTIDGKEYLLEKPLHADVAALGVSKADEMGNLFWKGNTRNMNNVMATAADIVIAEVQEIVPAGAIPPECVHTPYIYVDYLVK